MSYSTKHYGRGDPKCPICGGVGYVRYNVPDDHPYFGKAFDCECRKGQVQVDRQDYLRQRGDIEYLADKTLDSFAPEGIALPEQYQENLRNVFQRVVSYAQNPQGWLVLVGGHGCGKTHLAAGIANAQIKEGRDVLFLNVPDLLDYLRAAFRPSRNEEESFAGRFEQVRNSPLLILDDLGVESSTPWANEKLYQILSYRYTAKLPTLITTNYDLEDLEEGIRSRLYDIDFSQVAVINAPDYRRGTTGKVGGFKDLSPYATMTFDSFEPRNDLSKPDRDNLRTVLEVAQEYAKEPTGWLLFLGPHGTGKTHLAAAIAHTQTQSFQGLRVSFTTVPDLLDHLRSSFAPDSATSYDKEFEQIKTAPLLVLDDLEMSSATPWAREKLDQIFNHRHITQLPTVITTVHKLEQLDELDSRLATRIRDQRICRRIAFTMPPYLGRQRSKSPR